MEKSIPLLLDAGDILKKAIDPEGILANGTVTSICHRISDDREEFAWKAEVEFPNDDILKIRGHFKPDTGSIIHRCIYKSKDEKTVLATNASKTLLKSIDALTQLPARMKANLARISQETASSGQVTDDYAMTMMEMAGRALLWEVDGNELTETRRFQFNEISMSLKKDPSGFYSKNTIIGSCTLEGATIKARTVVDMYGLSSQALTLERPMGNKDEISAYCYTEDFTGRKVPSLRVAFRLYYMLAGITDLQQRRMRNSMNAPAKKKNVRKEQKATRSKTVSGMPLISERHMKDREDRYKYPERIQKKH